MDKMGNKLQKRVLDSMGHEVLVSEGKVARFRKEALRDEIRAWCENFEKEEGRKPEDGEDVEPIQELITEWN
jgi:hypothetical protein